MSKGGKKGGKKTDEDLIIEMKTNLALDIEILEHNIHLEEQRELDAIRQYQVLIASTQEEQKLIENNKNDEIRKLSISSDNLRNEEQNNLKSIRNLESKIREQDLKIDDLEKQIIENAKIYKKEEDDRDEAIKNQRILFEEMTVRFHHILENTANKLQERVKMGS